MHSLPIRFSSIDHLSHGLGNCARGLGGDEHDDSPLFVATSSSPKQARHTSLVGKAFIRKGASGTERFNSKSRVVRYDAIGFEAEV